MNQPLTHKDLVGHAYNWLSERYKITFRELVAATHNGEIPDVIGFGSGVTVIVECKASRADFLADRKKHFRLEPSKGMGMYRLYCCPEGLIKPEELPAKWGLLYVADGIKEIVRVIHHYEECAFEERDSKSETAILYSALRRLKLRKKDCANLFSTPPTLEQERK
jgi:hypothetical protein